jgi:hypothetical protein
MEILALLCHTNIPLVLALHPDQGHPERTHKDIQQAAKKGSIRYNNVCV